MTGVVGYEAAAAHDLDELVELRIEAMRESLARLGRFDPVRARERFASGFEPAWTRHVLLDGQRVGFLVVKPHPDGLLLDHLYLRANAQGRGVGSRVLSDVLADADARRLAILVGALRESAANAFYIRHGFRRVHEADWDVYYRRDPQTLAATPH
jgi:ribosomal protein S18 acetylase RimI-like enzyme